MRIIYNEGDDGLVNLGASPHRLEELMAYMSELDAMEFLAQEDVWVITEAEFVRDDVVVPVGAAVPKSNAVAAGIPYTQCPYEIVDDADIPTDRTFRNAWEHDTSAAPEKIKCNITNAKIIAHAKRRIKRDAAYRPYDELIAVDIPGSDIAAANAARDAIRSADAIVQTDIDAAADESGLKTILVNYGAV